MPLLWYLDMLTASTGRNRLSLGNSVHNGAAIQPANGSVIRYTYVINIASIVSCICDQQHHGTDNTSNCHAAM